jgi:hypothetical protein
LNESKIIARQLGDMEYFLNHGLRKLNSFLLLNVAAHFENAAESCINACKNPMYIQKIKLRMPFVL